MQELKCVFDNYTNIYVYEYVRRYVVLVIHLVFAIKKKKTVLVSNLFFFMKIVW